MTMKGLIAPVSFVGFGILLAYTPHITCLAMVLVQFAAHVSV